MARNNNNRKQAVICSEVVQVALLPEYVDDMQSRKVTMPQIMKELSETLVEGYSINLMYDKERTQFSARMAGVSEGLPNEGKLLYGNGITLDNALISLWIKHFLASGGREWVGTQDVFADMS